MKKEITKHYWSNGNLMYEVPLNKNGQEHGILKGYYMDSKILWHKMKKKNDVFQGARITFQYFTPLAETPINLL